MYVLCYFSKYDGHKDTAILYYIVRTKYCLMHFSKLCEVLANKGIYEIVSRTSPSNFATIRCVATHRLRNTALT